MDDRGSGAASGGRAGGALARPRCPRCAAEAPLVHTGLVDRHFGQVGGPAAPAAARAAEPAAVPAGWSIRACADCALHWLDPAPRGAALEAAYREYYTHEPVARGGFEALVKRAVPAATLGYADRVAPWERRLGALLARLGPLRPIGEHALMWLPAGQRGRVLDVGCGAGELLVDLQAFGWEVEGVEPDARGARAAREATGGAEIHESIDAALRGGAGSDSGSARPREGRFDALTLSHVVEHLEDPSATLRACWRALRPGGLLVVATPNAASLGRARFGASWLHWDPPRHLQLYETRSLVALLEEAGFAVRRTFTSAGSAHFVHAASARIERDGRLPGIEVRGASLRERLASLVFWLREHRAARRCACGEELVAIAVREGSRTRTSEADDTRAHRGAADAGAAPFE